VNKVIGDDFSDLNSRIVIKNNNIRNDVSESKANAQANLISTMQSVEFFKDNIKLKEEKTYVIEMNLYNINQKYKEYDIKKSLKQNNIQIVKIELLENPITGIHEERAKLTIRIKESDISKAENIFYDMNIRAEEEEDESNTNIIKN
jgi:hypothetical protein